jgi:hypothetical protein
MLTKRWQCHPYKGTGFDSGSNEGQKLILIYFFTTLLVLELSQKGGIPSDLFQEI